MKRMKEMLLRMAPAVMLLFSGALIFLTLGHFDIWYDEAFSYKYSFPQRLLKLSFNDFHFPLYYFLIGKFTALFGSGLFSLRFLSAVFFAVSGIIFIKIARRLVDRSTAVLAAAFFLFSPFMAWYAQEARYYTLMLLEILALVYLLITPPARRGKMLCLIMILVLMLFTGYIIIAYGIITMIFLWRFGIKRPVAYCLAIGSLLAMLPLYNMISRHLYLVRISFWAPPRLPSALPITFNNFLFGYMTVPAGYMISLALTGCILSLIAVHWAWQWKTLPKWPYILAFFFPFAVFLASYIFPMYVDRFFICSAPFYYLLAARALRAIPYRGIRTASIFVVLSWLGIALVLYYTGLNEARVFAYPGNFRDQMHIGAPFKHPYVRAIDFLEAHSRAGDLVCYSSRDIQLPMEYYLKYQRKNRKRLDIMMVGLKAAIQKDQPDTQVMKNRFLEGRAVALDEEGLPLKSSKKSLWLLTSSWNRGEKLPTISNAFMVRGYMMRQLVLSLHADIDGIIIERFELP